MSDPQPIGHKPLRIKRARQQPCIHIQEQLATGGSNPLDKPNAIIYYEERTNRYGILVRDQPDNRAISYVEITHCPWCGKELPKDEDSK